VQQLGHDIVMVMANGEPAQQAVLHNTTTAGDLQPLQPWVQTVVNPAAEGFAAPHPMVAVGFRGGHTAGTSSGKSASKNAQAVAKSISAAFQQHVTGVHLYLRLLGNYDDGLWQQGTVRSIVILCAFTSPNDWSFRYI